MPAQFRSAWRLETKRLGDERHAAGGIRALLGSRVLHGLVLEWGVALAILVALGAGAFAVYVLQALLAVRLLEAVNYFEHWGLERNRRRAAPDRLVGHRLVVHALHAGRPLAARRSPRVRLARRTSSCATVEESPKLPYGYFGTVVLVLFADHLFRAHATAELRRRGLGPFAPAAAEPAAVA